MHQGPFLKQIYNELISVHKARVILLYGSQADGSSDPNSDYDIAAFCPVEKPIRDARRVDDVLLDLFIYPVEVLLNPAVEYLRLRGGMIVLQRETEAESFLVGLDAIYDRGPELLPADEIQARKIWALKMVQRMERGDVEGNYRRVWLLSALLEDYFHIRSLWYQGPKKSLKWLNEFDAPVYTAFCVALAPGASNAAVLSLAHLVVDSEKSLH